MAKRRNHSAAFKAKVAIEALKGDKTLSELSSQYGVHSNQIGAWKKQLVEASPGVFGGKDSAAAADREEQIRRLHEKIGQLRGAGFFSEGLRKTVSAVRRREMIGRACVGLSVARQCALLEISRSGFYRTPLGESEESLALMRRIDELFLECPFFGSRQMARALMREGFSVGRHRVRRLMALMGLRAVYCRPRTSDPHPGHKIYPYLLRELSVTRADQVWCADITYIPMRRGFLYLVAVMDWHSRKVMSWRLSNTMEAGFCVEALEEAFAKHGRPEIFNTDQGSQFTSSAFIDALKGAVLTTRHL
jgi:putative transposase